MGINQTTIMLSSFKGAMTFQPWIRDYWDILEALQDGFKGAMTFQPWIPLLWLPG